MKLGTDEIGFYGLTYLFSGEFAVKFSEGNGGTSV
jgi:hypothetical protein